MTKTLAKRFPNLGKLSIALLEHIVEPVLGDKAIHEIKSPSIERELQDILAKALDFTEKRFIYEYSDRLIAEAVLNLPLANLPVVLENVRFFYLRPTDKSLANTLQSQLESTLPSSSKERIEFAVSSYLRILRDELISLPGQVREKLQAIATLGIQDNTTRIADTLERLEEHITNTLLIPDSIQDQTDGILKVYLNILSMQSIETVWNNEPILPRLATFHPRSAFINNINKPNTQTNESELNETLEDILLREHKIILLGEPGIGKTTSLQQYAKSIAIQSATKKINEAKIPIYAELRTYRGEHFEIWLAEQVEKVIRRHNKSLGNSLEEQEGYLRKWLMSSNNFVLLFDGLNEVHPTFYAKIRDELRNWLKYQYQVVISCREHEYDESLSRYAAAYIMTGLDYDGITKYLQARLGEHYDADEWYSYEIAPNEKLVYLVSNPFMLRLITDLAISDPKARLPANRGVLLQRFAEIMSLDKATSSNFVSPKIVEGLLSQLAYEMTNHGILQINLMEALKWDLSTPKPIIEILEQSVQIRFLKSDGQLNEPIEFFHQIFQEYFTAFFLANRLLDGESFETVLTEKQFEDMWQEPIVMLASMIKNPSQLVIWLSENHIRYQRPISYTVIECLESTDALDNALACEALSKALVRDLIYSDEPKPVTLKAIHTIRQHAAFFLRSALENADEKQVWHIGAGLLMARESPPTQKINAFFNIEIPEKLLIGLIAKAYGLSREDYLNASSYILGVGEQAIPLLIQIAKKSKVARIQTIAEHYLKKIERS